MNHGSQTIQPERGASQVREKTAVRPRKLGKSEDRFTGETAECECCKNTFRLTRGSKGRFCGYDCFYADKAKGIEAIQPCATCHSVLRMTGAASGRMLNTTKVRICELRKKFGMQTLTNSEAQVRQQIRVHGMLPWWGGKDEGKAWISEYNPRFPDWSAVWHKEEARRKAAKYPSQYQGMTDKERRARNKATWARVKERCATDPDFRAKRRAYVSKWRAANPGKASGSVREAIRKRKIIDPGFKAQCNLRKRMKDIMRSARKGGWEGIPNFTGCNTKQLARHLESCFTKRMSWANYGTYWHVDHILPCSSFDHTDPKQVAQCWHWTNLRALEAKKNMDKSDTITEPQMSLMLCATH